MSYDVRNPIESLALSVLESLGGSGASGASLGVEERALNEDYYTLLDVARTAQSEDIHAAIQKLRSASTPITFHVKEALNNAELVLLNPELRSRYDATLD